MRGSRIQTRIWLSCSIYVVGFLLSTVVSVLEQRDTARQMAAMVQATFPAARRSHDAEKAFQVAVNEYADAVLTQEHSGVLQGDIEAAHAVDLLNRIADARDLSPSRTAVARTLGSSVNAFREDAHRAYEAVISAHGALAGGLQEQCRLLAGRTNDLKAELHAFDVVFTQDVQRRMDELQSRSARTRWFTLSAFTLTLIVASGLVHFTIRRYVLLPLTRTQAEVNHERDLLRILMDHVPDYIYFKDANLKYVMVNRALASLIGLPDPAAILGREDSDYFQPAIARKYREGDLEILRTGKPLIGEVEPIAGANGQTRWLTTTKILVPGAANTPTLIVGISRDTTEWKKVIESLERSEASFRLLFSAIPHAVWVCERLSLKILEVNEAATSLYSFSTEEFQTMTLADVYPPDDHERLWRSVAEMTSTNLPHGERKHLTKDKRVLDVEIAVHLLQYRGHDAFLITAQDISDRKKLELELRQAQRLEAVGQLAAGIAHEINTPIQFIGDNLRFLNDAFKDRQIVMEQYSRLLHAARTGEVTQAILDDLQRALEAADMEYVASEIPKAIEQSLDGVDRVAKIVRAMKAFAHPGQKEKAAADLNKALSDALIVARNELKYVADVATDFGDLPPVLCHLADMNQVFLNLLVNAAHAIAEVVGKTGAKGQITVATRIKGDQAVISISDTGCGIPEHIRSRVFDPFFTTKEVGRGTGQGLSLARTVVVEKHGGRIHFEPNSPQGTTFIVSIPLSPALDHGDQAA